MLTRYALILGLFAVLLQAVVVAPDTQAQSLLSQSEYCIDKTSEMDREQISTCAFVPVGTDYIRLGYTHSALWIRFSLENPSGRLQQRELEVDNCMLDTVTLYRPDGSAETTGVLHKQRVDCGRLHPYFRLTLPPHSEGTYYLRTQTDSCANYFRLTLLTPDAAWGKELHYQLALALFFGAMLALIVYNLFVWLFTRERVYFYYVLYLFSWVMTHMSFSCMGQHLFADIPWFITVDAFLGLYYNVLNVILMLLFFKAFFRTPLSFPKINRFFNGVILYFLALSIVSLSWAYLIEVLTLSVLVLLPVIGALLLYWLFREPEQAKYLFVGWMFAIAGIISLALDQLGIPNPIDRWRFFFEFSIVTEALLFSVALAARLNKNRALEQALATQKILLNELLHRVKNNMQTIISMYRIKLADATEKTLRSKMDEVERTVQAMSRIHEMLYAQKDIGEVEAESYLDLLVEQLAQSAPPGVVITLSTDVRLATDRAIYCAVIINELVTNALKHAFGPEGGRIGIGLHRIGATYVLEVLDNGKGMETDKEEGFGLGLVRAFAEDELGGTLEVEIDGGSHFIIRFKA